MLPLGATEQHGPHLPLSVDTDLAQAAVNAQGIDPVLCREHALKFSWDTVVSEFVDYLAPFTPPQEPSAQAAQ